MDPKYKNVSFRDKISTISTEGTRLFIHPRKPKGKFTNWRKIVGYFLLLVLISLPLIKVNGEPFVMLNFIERKFIIFGAIFWPQDTFVLLLMTLSFLVFVLLFTTTFGRLFCGWACPQTIFLEIVFRPIEFLIDGDGHAQRKLKEAPWTASKFAKRILKHSIFLVLSLVFVNIIIWYFMSFEKWLHFAQDYNNHRFGIALIALFSLIFYFIYSWFREQICLIVCPYGRMQGVLVDRSTIMVIYDYIRGESRGGFKKDENRTEAGKGDCVACNLCIEVCPTGIDIRNGAQLECVNCTACIDACDHTMERFNLPKGLIRYASENSVANQTKNHFSVRTKAYSLALIAVLGFFIYVLASRTAVEAVILRSPGVLSQAVGTDSVSNLYNIKVVNKTRTPMQLDVRLIDQEGQVKLVGNSIEVKAESRTESVLFVQLHKKDIKGKHDKIKLGIFVDGKIIDQTNVSFINLSN